MPSITRDGVVIGWIVPLPSSHEQHWHWRWQGILSLVSGNVLAATGINESITIGRSGTYSVVLNVPGGLFVQQLTDEP